MAFWDSWFGGHDADVNLYGWKRRRFFDNIHSGFLISRSKRRQDRPEFSDFARNFLGNAGLLGLSGVLSGGWSMPAFLVGAKGFMTFGEGLGSIKGHLRTAALTDHALGGTLFEKLQSSNARLTPEAQRIIGRIFGTAGAVNVGTIRTLINADANGTRSRLNTVLRKGYVGADGVQRFLNTHEKSELTGMFGLGFLDNWSRTRLHPALAASGAVGAALANARANGQSFYQALSTMPQAAQEQFYDGVVARNPNLAPAERLFLHDVLSGQREADNGSTKAFNKILGGAFAVGLASVIEGNLGNTAAVKAQQADIQHLNDLVNQHGQVLQDLPKNLNVVVDAQTGLAMVHNKVALQGILGRGNVDPTIGGVGAGYKGTVMQADSGGLPADVINANQGLLVQKIQTMAQFNPFVKSVTAHLDWGNTPGVLAALHDQAALAAGGAAIHPGWAFALGALTDFPPVLPPGIKLPPGTKPPVRPPGKQRRPSKQLTPEEFLAEAFRRGRIPGKQRRPSRAVSAEEYLDEVLPGRGKLPGKQRRSSQPGFEGNAESPLGRPRSSIIKALRKLDGLSPSDAEDAIRNVIKYRDGVLEFGGPGKRRRLKISRPSGEPGSESESDSEEASESELRSNLRVKRQLGAPGAFELERDLGLPSGSAGEFRLGGWRAGIGIVRPLPTHEESPDVMAHVGGPAGIATPATPHASELAQLLSSDELRNDAQARASIGRELESLRKDGVLIDSKYFGMQDKYLEKTPGRPYGTLEGALRSNTTNLDQVVKKLADPALSSAESEHLHAAILRGVLHHLGSQDAQHANRIAGTMNELASEGHLRFESGGLRDAQRELQSGNVRAVQDRMVSPQGRPTEELFHGVNAIRPISGAVPSNSHHEVHGRLIHTARQILRG